jgi:microcin C transport system permease protein
MFNYFIRRLLLIIPTFLGCTMLVFAILQYTPNGPFERAIEAAKGAQMQGEGGGVLSGPQGQVAIPKGVTEELMRYYNLDKPVPIRYVLWLGKIVQGDFGKSDVYGDPVLTVISKRLPISLYFGFIGFFLSYLVCIPLGIIKAIRHGSTFDFASSALIFIGYAVPGWALGVVLRTVISGQLELLPLEGFHDPDWDQYTTSGKTVDLIRHSILPLIAYMIGGFATLTILMKNSLLENLGQDYVRTAFAKGLSERRVVFVHAMRNSLIPIATGLGGALSIVIAGSILIERAFNIDGFGYVGFRSATERDYMVVMGILVISVILRLLGNILSDFLYALIDPRIRFK